MLLDYAAYFIWAGLVMYVFGRLTLATHRKRVVYGSAEDWAANFFFVVFLGLLAAGIFIPSMHQWALWHIFKLTVPWFYGLLLIPHVSAVVVVALILYHGRRYA